MQFIENRTFDEITIGETADLTRTLKAEDIELFAVMSGDVNPAHVDEEYASSDVFHKVIAHGMWGGALISAVLGTELPGPGTIYLDQNLSFRAPVGVGDTVTIRVTVADKDTENHHVTLDCICLNQKGETVIEGAARVIAPTQKVRRPRVSLPDVQLHHSGAMFEQLIETASQLEAMRTAVVHPCDALSLKGALESQKRGLIVPILIGPTAKIKAAAAEINADLSDVEIIDVPYSHAAADLAVEMARTGKVDMLMKGKIHTDELLDPVVDKTTGLRTERRISHVFVLDVPHYSKPLLISDAAINIFPDLNAKKDIVQNAIDLACSLGNPLPKVALLSAVETVTNSIPSTLDAASLCKMADRGQITGGVLDGPLAFDNAVSKAAAKTKGIVSPVAGESDILIVPDLEAGNMIAKQLIYLAGADSAGVVLGARVPIVLTSRADGVMSRLASTAMAQLFIHHQSTKTLA
ncbi:bifunctional enoyl-CoA hydratase/phosphate acetyltransferase [Sulfitobacter donghicola]|uniref:Bifunctional enoyl-CoA hydratase/phosphate acetyltransferase n=1 Tax=Sulfitobacter donghicola DSW-25 = KCTC 12864 = JCM 14565 TaxID=1300350 RepID=A0A073IEH0_9RHOB|nr:bifunctional enoyl-CoA hydratase/phosphate acetyltransferase [Sulfitobacter donghicola]KEJ88129.1 bifunctional enoyl-CoA hydratase/phosphate acetyltransferase [Sulfitobacter donghicola DSW-25 = KCTC 12864 = JCM 14565]KIN70064.1 MaoC family protein/phosphate acetyl/butaryl transferase [Sulfitobacter donghicola DSW-25 = KCTC 12864 = JCM 14565]